MKYEVFTDGACNPQKGLMSSAFMIRTNTTFVGSDAKVFEGNNIAIAETIAVGLGAVYLLENVEISKDDYVVFRTDCRSTYGFFYGYSYDADGKQTNENPIPFTDAAFEPKTKDERVKLVCKAVQELAKKCTVEIISIDGHLENFNGNKVADRLAKYQLGCMSKK